MLDIHRLTSSTSSIMGSFMCKQIVKSRHADLSPEKFTNPMSDSMSDPMSDPMSDSMSDPMSDSMPNPNPITNSITEPVTEPVIDQVLCQSSEILSEYYIDSTYSQALQYGKKIQLGSGSYGTVYIGERIDTKFKIAIKEIKMDYLNCKNTKLYKIDMQFALNELIYNILLSQYNNNICSLYDISYENNKLFLVFSKYDSSLDKIIHNNILTNDHYEFIFYQIALGLKYLHMYNIFHADLKPSNIFINENCHTVIGDLGICWNSTLRENHPNPITQWYRPPEILQNECLGENKEYDSHAADMWSLGIILLEMIPTGSAIMGKADDVIDQLSLTNIFLFERNTPEKWKSKYPNISNELLLILQSLLCRDPVKRITAEQLCELPFFEKWKQHVKLDFPIIKMPVIDLYQLNSNDYIRIFYELSELHHTTGGQITAEMIEEIAQHKPSILV